MANPPGHPGRCELWCTNLFRVAPHLRGGIVPSAEGFGSSEPCVGSRRVPAYHSRCAPVLAPPCEHIPFVEKRGYTPAPMDPLHLAFDTSRSAVRYRTAASRTPIPCHSRSKHVQYPPVYTYERKQELPPQPVEPSPVVPKTAKKWAQPAGVVGVEGSGVASHGHQTAESSTAAAISTLQVSHTAVAMAEEAALAAGGVAQAGAAMAGSAQLLPFDCCNREEVHVLEQTDSAIRYLRSRQSQLDSKFSIGIPQAKCTCGCTCECTCVPPRRQASATPALAFAASAAARGSSVAADGRCLCSQRKRVVTADKCTVCGQFASVVPGSQSRVAQLTQPLAPLPAPGVVDGSTLICPGVALGATQHPLATYHPSITIELCELMRGELQRQQHELLHRLGRQSAC